MLVKHYLNLSVIFQKLPDSYYDATEVPLSNHLTALHDEAGETDFSGLTVAVTQSAKKAFAAHEKNEGLKELGFFF